jgi:very-short-patch-repair endonuclease
VPAARRPDVLRGRVFRKADVVTRGLITSSELRSSAWRRLYRGVYADASLPDSVALRVAGAKLLIPEDAAFSGRTAAFLHGAAELADLRAPVEVSVPTDVRFGPVTGLRIRQVRLAPQDVVLLQGRRCTTALRTALDIARTEPLPDAVAALDVLLGRVVVGKGELVEAAQRLDGRGAQRGRKAVGLADPRAESQPESRLRVELALAGLFPEVQYTVRDPAGDFVARVDLAFREQRIAIEYDGAWHAEPGQFAKDRRRLNRLVAAGWTVVHVTAADLRDPAALIARLKALLAAATSGK